MKGLGWLIAICHIVVSVSGDLYVHNPRGSNNRLNENTATRANNNRMFDSQNNARGGYNYGDTGSGRSTTESQQYRMKYFQSGSSKSGDSELVVEWTNQHGCGGDEDTSPHKLNCNMVLQFMCQDADSSADESLQLRNGQSTQTQAYTKPNNDVESENTLVNRRKGNINPNKGLHESWEWYDNCYRRERNKGLFVADQQLNDNKFGVSSAIFTRQNPTENRRGYECPEERDYYPYFHPTPWVDIAVLSHNASGCSYYKEKSFNAVPLGQCIEKWNANDMKHFSTVNNPEDCAAKEGAEWVELEQMLELAPKFKTEAACVAANSPDKKETYKWGKPYIRENFVNHVTIKDTCFVAPPPLDCKPAEWSRVNHLGNGRDGQPLNYTWKLPYFPSEKEKRCVFRMRYNISTDDYDPFQTDAKSNEQKENNVVIKRSPIEQNPLLNVGARGQLLQLAINTDQTGRVFQDRSHVFHLLPRKNDIPQNVKVANLNVRGKRGNIVQVYPAVEYDFVPNDLRVTENDYIHVQWTGSNTHNNNAPGGDGQTGDAGEGKGGTDRNNMVQLLNPEDNYPATYEKTTMFQNMNLKWPTRNIDPKDVAIQFATSGYYECESGSVCGGNSVQNKAQINNLLNNAPASFSGKVFTLKPGQYHYMCTRNNNFSNRSQKGKIIVTK